MTPRPYRCTNVGVTEHSTAGSEGERHRLKTKIQIKSRWVESLTPHLLTSFYNLYKF